MFGFLLSEQRKMRQNAGNWLEVADRVYKFRRDQLTEAQSQRLLGAVGELRTRLKEKADASRLKLSIETLEAALRDAGGRMYPVSSMVENVEFFLVAAIVILGIRAYFVQPFKIPTNSMWPSYYGKTHEVHAPDAQPGLATKAWRFLTLGAWHYQVNSPADGELMVPFFENGQPAFTQVQGRSFLVFPTIDREYLFAVGGQEVRLKVPGPGTSTEDFRYERVLREMLYQLGDGPALARAVDSLQRRRGGQSPRQSTLRVLFNGTRSERTIHWLPSGRLVRKGEPILSFDILTGDLLFVDRISYQFVRPSVGQGFVFHTRQIPGIGADQYYIKRLVGEPGDTLRIEEPVLFRNGAPITGSAAFAKNAQREGLFRGYFDAPDSSDGTPRYLKHGETITVPPGNFFALGDNSSESADSRYWGFIPEKEVVGRPLFIYYPFTRRWGPAR